MLKLRRNLSYSNWLRLPHLRAFHSRSSAKMQELTEQFLKSSHPQLFFTDDYVNQGNALFSEGRMKMRSPTTIKQLKFSWQPDVWYQALLWWNYNSMKTRSSRLIKPELKPDDPGIWDHRGIALKELRQYEAALASFDKQFKFSENYKAWLSRGLTLRNWNFTKTRSLRLTKPFSSSPIIMKLGLIEVLCWFFAARGSFHFLWPSRPIPTWWLLG